MELRDFGLSRENDTHRDLYIYTLGYNGHIPISLILLIASSHKNAVARYFNMFTHTEHAKKLEKELLQQKISLTDDFRQQFDGDEPAPAFLKKMINSKDQKETSNLPLHIYAKEFAKIIAMKTPEYESQSEGVVLTCPMSYINFWNREEFTVIEKNINNAGMYILSEVMRIFELRGIAFNKHSMTLPHQNYRGFNFKVSYGF